MIHLVFSRPQKTLKIYHSDKSLRFVYEASGAACANSNGPMPQGHYILLEPQLFARSSWDSSLESEGVGWGRVRIRDMSDNDVQLLVNANLATKNADASLSIGGVSLMPGSCNAYGRVIEIHGGGSALRYPGAYTANQELCCTLGCTRMHNQDVKAFIQYMDHFLGSDTFVFSAIGAPSVCSC